MSNQDIRKVMQQMGSKGGKQAAQNMTVAQRKARARKAATAKYAKRKKVKCCECGKPAFRQGMLIVFNWQQLCQFAGWKPKDIACAPCMRKMQRRMDKEARNG